MVMNDGIVLVLETLGSWFGLIWDKEGVPEPEPVRINPIAYAEILCMSYNPTCDVKQIDVIHHS